MVVLCLLAHPAGVMCAQENGASAGADDTAFGAFLSQLKNPFLTAVPQAVVTVVDNNVPAPVKTVVAAAVPVRTAFTPAAVLPVPDLKISGVVWAAPKPQAIIDGEVVGIGDTVKGAKVIAIRKSGVDLSIQGRTFAVGVQQ